MAKPAYEENKGKMASLPRQPAFRAGAGLFCTDDLVLLEVASGKAFTVKNYRRLFYIAGIIALFPITSLFTQVILQWSYRSYYAGDLLPDFDSGNKISWMLAALVVFLLALAFRKGYRMQQEQELTI